jgi:hypothetical protein
MLQYRLPGMSRTTQDIDGLVRGDIDHFLTALDATLDEPWGPLTLVRGEVETIDIPYKLVKPRRFDMTVLLNGVTWRRVQVEVSPEEGGAGTAPEHIPSPSLAGFGLPTPDHLVSLSMRYQIAQKVHASTDPHDPPAFVNDRARDVVDLLLLRELIESTGPSVAGRHPLRGRGHLRRPCCGSPRRWGPIAWLACEADCPSALGAELRQSRRVGRGDDPSRRRRRAHQRLAGPHRARLKAAR